MRCATPHGFTHRLRALPQSNQIVGHFWTPIPGQCSMPIDNEGEAPETRIALIDMAWGTVLSVITTALVTGLGIRLVPS